MANINNLNRFEWAPVDLNISRSRFKVPHSHKTTFNSGELIPVGLFEVLPSDTFKIDLSAVVRSVTPVVPTMDNAFLDVYAFFVPNRIAAKHPKDWEKIMGENIGGYWAPASESTMSSTGNSVASLPALGPNSIGGYMGLPYGISINTELISKFPLSGYVSIFNEWFRDQNVQAPYSLDSSSVSYAAPAFKVNKFRDYFTSCLPSPQKGYPVSLPVGDIAPIKVDLEDYEAATGTYVSYQFRGNDTPSLDEGRVIPVNSESGAPSGQPQNASLYADLTKATGATINSLRQAFAIQRMLEKDARGGSRYREILRTHYGSNIPDSTIQIPQYLGGKRIPLNVTQVLQTSSTDDVSPLGSTGAFSNTAFNNSLCLKSFDEHGYIHVVACIRPNQTYSQGIPKHFTRQRRFDWYFPSFANLGEQAVLNKEIYFQNAKVIDNNVFGYQEAWAEYRFIPNRVSGLLAPANDDLSLTPWTYTNNFSNLPTLTSYFMQQDKAQIGDTLAVTDSNYQYIADFYFDMEITRAMPTYSIPGLIDHN